MLYHKMIDTPLGKMHIAATDAGICLFDFEHRRSLDAIMGGIEARLGMMYEDGEHPYFALLEQQITEYFDGTRKEFDLPLQMTGTPFQVSVWQGLLHIPYGETRSYKEQSIFLGDEKAVRAVASANGKNSLEIIVPCHRVIGGDGSLTGYGGGLEFKKWLLAHEQKHSDRKKSGELF